MSWTTLPPLLHPRAGHSATVLGDGRVLIAGGGRRERAHGECDDSDVGSLREVELFVPGEERFVPAAAMHAPREGHAALLLPGGDVLVAGGMLDLVWMRILAGVERWHPERDAWSDCVELPQPCFGHTLASGGTAEVLAVGGQGLRALQGALRWGGDGHRWQHAEPMITPRYLHAQVSLGSALYIIGGIGEAQDGFIPQRSLAAVERWSAGRGFEPRASLPYPCAEPAVVALSPTELLLSGGYDDTGGLRSCLLYDARRDRWQPLGELNEARAGHDMVRLADGRVLAIGGLDESFEQPVTSAELWEPASARWVQLDGPSQPRAGATHSLLAGGRLLVAGGRHQGVALDSAELFTL